MFISILLALATAVVAARAQVYKGFNYGSVFTDGSAITEPDYESRFSTAQQLVGTSGFTSARLFTMIQAGTTNSPTQAIPAAISTNTSLLLGLFLSSDQAVFSNELAALSSAISMYGQNFIELIVAISVGSEDLYRISPIGVENESGAGVGPAQVVEYLGQVRSLIAGTPARGKPVGHVDTWTAWVNSSNNAVIDASDFIGMDAYPYFQNTMSNAIGNGRRLFFEAYNATVAVSGGKPVWITETGWPVSGPNENLAVASIGNAETYWSDIGCSVFGKINTWWFILQDAFPTAPSPSFGLVGTTLSNVPLYNLSCDASSSSLLTSGSTSTSLSASALQSPKSLAQSSPSADMASSTGTSSSVAVNPSKITTYLGRTSENPSSPQSATATIKHAPPKSASEPATTTLPVTTYTVMTTGRVTYVSDHDTRTSLTISPVVQISTMRNTPSAPNLKPGTTNKTAVSTTESTTSSCPASLSGQFQFPHLIVPVDRDHPNVAQGTVYSAHLSPAISSLFNFDIPPAYRGLTCSLVFHFPTRESLQTSNYTVSGSGGIEVVQLVSPATAKTTYDNLPAIAADVGSIADLRAGSSHVISSEACAAGSRIGYEISATGSLDLEYFQDYNPAPIGLYITAC